MIHDSSKFGDTVELAEIRTMTTRLPRDHDWPYANWVPNEIKNFVRYRLLSPWCKKSRSCRSVRDIDVRAFKALVCGNEYGDLWRTVIDRLKKKGGPSEELQQHISDPRHEEYPLNLALLLCVRRITSLPITYSRYSGAPTYIAKKRLNGTIEAIDALRDEIAGSAQLLPEKYLDVGYLEAQIGHDPSSARARWNTRTESPTTITDTLAALRQLIQHDISTRRWTRLDKTQYYIDGVLRAFRFAFGFAYPAVTAKIVGALMDGFQKRSRVPPTEIQAARVLARAKKLKIPAQ